MPAHHRLPFWSDAFAEALARIIDEEFAVDLFTDLVLVAPSAVLRDLTAAIEAPTRTCLLGSLTADLVSVPDGQLRPFLMHVVTEKDGWLPKSDGWLPKMMGGYRTVMDSDDVWPPKTPISRSAIDRDQRVFRRFVSNLIANWKRGGSMSPVRKLCFVIADGGHARFVRPAADNALHTFEAVDSTTVHKRDHDLVSDRPGRAFESGVGGAACVQPADRSA